MVRAPRLLSPAAAWAALISLALIGVYGQTLGFEFVRLDDDGYLVRNGVVSQGLSLEGLRWALSTDSFYNWFPLTWLSFMLGVELYGLDPGWHHATNVALHWLNTLLLFAFLRAATQRVGASALVAALFALHPLHVEAVAWVSERKELLATCFGLLALASYLGWARRGGAGRYALVLLCAALSLMSKPMWVTLPALLLLLDYWPLRRLPPSTGPGLGRLLLEKLPLLGLSLVSSAITLRVQPVDAELGLLRAGGWLASVENAVVSYAWYLGKTLWPTGLAPLYPHPAMPWEGGVALTAWQVGGSLTLLLAISAAVVALRRRRYLLVGWLWYLGTLVPVIGLVQVGRQALADRYSYVPLIGLFLMLALASAEGVERWQRRWPPARLLASAGACGLLLLLSVVCHAQVGVWRDSVSLFEHALSVTPRNPTIHYNLGNTYGSLGRLDEAMEQYRRALAVKPQHKKAHYNLANLLAARNQRDEAIGHYREALGIDPGYARAHFKLAEALLRSSEIELARHHYRKALESDPSLGAARIQLERIEKLLGPEPR